VPWYDLAVCTSEWYLEPCCTCCYTELRLNTANNPHWSQKSQRKEKAHHLRLSYPSAFYSPPTTTSSHSWKTNSPAITSHLHLAAWSSYAWPRRMFDSTTRRSLQCNCGILKCILLHQQALSNWRRKTVNVVRYLAT